MRALQPWSVCTGGTHPMNGYPAGMYTLYIRHAYVYAPFERCACVLLIFFNILELFINVCYWPVVQWSTTCMGCHQGQHFSHNANNLPLWTWWQSLLVNCHLIPFCCPVTHAFYHIWYIFWMYTSEMIFYERVAIKYNTCIIMPTISPFGLDGNNTESLSPFDIKGKGLCSP